MDETDRPDDRRAAGSWVLSNSESRRQRNHEAAKSGIPKPRKPGPAHGFLAKSAHCTAQTLSSLAQLSPSRAAAAECLLPVPPANHSADRGNVARVWTFPCSRWERGPAERLLLGRFVFQAAV